MNSFSHFVIVKHGRTVVYFAGDNITELYLENELLRFKEVCVLVSFCCRDFVTFAFCHIIVCCICFCGSSRSLHCSLYTIVQLLVFVGVPHEVGNAEFYSVIFD